MLKNLQTSACLNINYDTAKQKPKENVEVVKMVEFIKTCNQYPNKFNFCHFFSSITLPPFCWVKNRFSENPVWRKMVISFCLG